MTFVVLRPAALLVLLLGGALLPWGAAHAELDEDEAKFPNEAYPFEFRMRVDAAIDRGAHWLLRRQRPDGSWNHRYNDSYPMGPTALATLAALKAGVPGDHPRMDQAFRYLRDLPPQKTYSVAVLLMALDARYGPARATFATEAVSRCGVDIPTRVWRDALEFHLGFQMDEGEAVEIRVNEVRGDYRIEWVEKAKARGFSYVANRPTTGSMTTAGLAGLLICQSELWEIRSFAGKLRRRTRDAIRDAFAWMQVNFSVHRNPKAGFGAYYYYLYGLERAGILGRVRFIGKHDWYREGADVLLAAQRADGSWRSGDLVDTCFAMLFLKRATFRTGNPALTPR